MNNTFKLLCKERQEFINGMKLRCDLSLKTKEDYYFGMEKAFDDAFNQYARRNKQKYANDKQKLMSPIVDRMFSYFNSPNDNFEDCFAECIELAKKILENNLYGIAQKFTNMSFKYLYCYYDADSFESKFEKCHIPLDKYTIRWIKSLKNENINKKLNNINNAWANIDKKLYDEIQELVTKTLNEDHNYVISFNQKSNEKSCVLPKNKLFAEFIIWHQEQLNELYIIVKRSEKDFERLGLQWK